MATADDYASWIVNNADKKGTPEFQTVAAAYQDAKTGGAAGHQARLDAQLASDKTQYAPTGGVVDNTLAGIGSGMTSVLRAVGGGSLAAKLGLPATQDEAAQTDAPLMATTAGKVGRAIGIAAPAALAIPFTPALTGVAGLATAAGVGAATGAATTEGGVGDRAMGALEGAGGGALGQALPAIYGVGKGIVKGLVEPITQAGRQRIAGRAIQQFATDPAALAAASGAPTITGALPTLAEATRDGGLATLQRTLGTMDPDAAAAFAARADANNAARVSTLGDIAGNPVTRDAAVKAREDVAGQMYKAATGATYTVDDKLGDLLGRPAVQQALARAKTLAENQGRKFTFDVEAPNPMSGLGVPTQQSKQITGSGLQDLKMAMDEMLSDPATGFTGKTGDVVKGLRSKLVGWMEDANPDFKAARTQYAELSKPINAMDVGERLMNKTTAAVRDMSGTPKLQANAFSRALNDEDGLMRVATGFRGPQSLQDTLTPSQWNKMTGVRSELETLSNLGNAANGAGSQTAKMLASQNMLRQIAGPVGLPEGFVSNVVSQNLQRLPNFIGYKAADPLIQQELSAALLNPAKALDFLAKARASDMKLPASQLQQLAQRAAPALSAGVGANRARQQ